MGSLRRSLSVLQAAALLWSVLLGPSALAQESAAVAEQLFLEGQELLDAKQYEAAREKFEASMAAEPSGGTALNLGRTYQLLGRTASAWAAFRRASTLLRASGETRREAFAREQADALEPTLSRLTIEVHSVPGLRVTVDAESIPRRSWGTAVPMDPGEHRVEAVAPGHASWSTTVTVGAVADAQTVTVPTLPAQAAEPSGADEEGVGATTIAGAVLIGVGIASAAVGGVLGGVVLSDVSDAEQDPALCPDYQCTPEGREAIDDAETRAHLATIFIAAGAVVAVGGAALVLFGQSSSDEPSAQLTPVVSTYGAAMHVTVPF